MEVAAWLDDFLPTRFDLPPMGPEQIGTAHQGGLNFSRAWGLYHLWQATGEPSWRDLYLDHIQTHIEQPEFWAEDYWAYSHWVPQFGVYAIARSYEAR